MANMTKEQIQAIGTAELRAIVRSTVSTPSSRYWMELQWARDELARRDRLREGVKKAVTGLGGTVAGRSFDQWRDLANCHVMWRVTDDQAERAVLLDKIAAKCCELERKGEIASIWHATALVTGRPCNCGQCAVEG